MSLADALNGYRLFLGREPEAERVVNDKASMPLPKMLTGFVGSREFSERVMAPLAGGYPLPHVRVSPFPSAELVAWASEVLPLAAGARDKVANARTWRQLLTQIVCDPGFETKFGRVLNDALVPAVRKREASAGAAGAREIVGWIDDTSIFEIRGWAANLMDLNTPLTLEFFLDNFFIGTAQATEFRRELQEKIGGAGNYAFSFIVPAAHHPDLQTERLLTVRDAISRTPIARPIRVRLGQTEAMDSVLRLHHELEAVAASLERLQTALPHVTAETEYPITMYDAYQKAARKALMARQLAQAAEASELAYSPGFSIVLLGSGESSRLIASINSLRRQTYKQWECIVAVPAQDDESRAILETLANDPRIRTVGVPDDSHLWSNANAGLRTAQRDYVIWLNEGDLLAEDGLFEIAKALQRAPASLVYFDEDLFTREGGKVRSLSPVLKTDFDHDHLLSANYIGNGFACTRALAERLAGFNGDFQQSWDYDFLFRAFENLPPEEVVHIERIVYRRHAAQQSSAEQDEAEAGNSVSHQHVACVEAHLRRTGAGAIAEPHTDPFGVPRPKCQRIVWTLPDPPPKVSIIIPTRDRADLMAPCLESVFESQPHYPVAYEIIVMDNDSQEPETLALFDRVVKDRGVTVLPYRSDFNWSAINNLAARHASGDILLFLNNDTRVLSPDWVRELASQAARANVGAVGARLFYEDGTIQHGGVVLGGRAVHEGLGERPGEGGYLGRTALQRNASAVTGACLATRRSLFLELGGFDEAGLKVAFNDVDYCLKVRAAGLAVIYTPFATLYHLESKSRGADDNFTKRLRSQSELGVMRARWQNALERDPFYNSRFNRTGRPFTRLRPPELLAVSRDLQGDERELWEQE